MALSPLDRFRRASPLSRFNRTSSTLTTPELQARVNELEALQTEFGAPQIEQTRPGVFRTLVDLLSRPNYAIAGFVDELIDETPSVTTGVKRALTEIFSGVGGLQGEKKAFGQILDDAGVGTLTLADAFPALENTWVGNFGSRGLAGIALDIATDPLTYMTFGASTGMKISGKFFNRAGRERFNEFLVPYLKDALARAPADKVGQGFARTRAVIEAGEEFVKEFGTDTTLLEKGGAKLFGQTIPGSDKIGGAAGAVLDMLPDAVRKPVVEGVTEMSTGMRRLVNGIFGPDGPLGNLPGVMRDEAHLLAATFRSTSTAHRSHLMGQAKDLERAYRKLAKADPSIGKRWYDVREGVPGAALKEGEEELYAATIGLYDSMGKTLVEHGAITADQIRTGYMLHAYKNIEDLAQYHPKHLGVPSVGTDGKITRERVFDSYQEAIDESTRLNRIAREEMSKGEADRLYPILEPEYDVFKNLESYINQHSSLLANQAFREELAARFGKPISELAGVKVSAVGDALSSASEAVAPLGKGKVWYQGVRAGRVGGDSSGYWTTSIGEARSYAAKEGGEAGEILVARAEDFPKGTFADPETTYGFVDEVVDLGPEEYARRHGIIGGADPSGFKRVKVDDPSLPRSGEFGAPKDFTPENVPLRRVVQEGDIDENLVKAFGRDGATYQSFKSKLTGDEHVYLPKAVIQAMEKFDAPLFNQKDYPEFAKLLKGFDWLNNNFKWGVYTIWPASATRDAYSNVALSMLRVGVAAMDPKRHIDAVSLMAGRELGKEFAGSGYTLGQLRDLSKTFGVWVPGQVFVEQTGKFKLGKVRRGLTEARAGIENEARILLWMEEIRRGADPRLAADTVGQFLFNYGEVSRVERDLFRRLIPFYTFTRKNVELQWKALRQKPGLVANQLKPFRGRKEENESMVEWEAEALKIRMDRDGKTVHMLTGIDLPLRNLDTLWRGSFTETGRSVLGMVTPVLKVIPEVLLDQDFFLGADLTRTQSAAIGQLMEKGRMPKGMKDWFGYKKEVDEAGRPRYTFDGKRFTLVFRSWAFSRAISTTDRQFRDNVVDGDPNVQKIFLDLLTGIRAKELNMDEQMNRRLGNRIRQLEESLARRGVFGEFRKRFKPRDRGQDTRFR